MSNDQLLKKFRYGLSSVACSVLCGKLLTSVWHQSIKPPCFQKNIVFPSPTEADVALSVGARPVELEAHQFDPRHSIDVCFDFPLFHVAVALNTRKTEL